MESSVGRLTKTVGQPETGCEPTWILAANKEPFTKQQLLVPYQRRHQKDKATQEVGVIRYQLWLFPFKKKFIAYQTATVNLQK